MKIVTVVGTRPQYVKAAPVSAALARREGVEEFMVDTGQHFDFEMSQLFIDELHLPPPAVNLGVSGKSHACMTAAMMPPIEDILTEQKPDIVLVYGDTNSTLSAALAAAKLDLRIAHIEGGIRTTLWNPEEINRRVVDTLSDDIFCPTRSSLESCVQENLEQHAHYTGDVMADTLRLVRAGGRTGGAFETLGLDEGEYVVMTSHRPENTNDPARFLRILETARREANGKRIIFPAHPRTVRVIEQLDCDMRGIEVMKPLGYMDMARVAGSAALIITDSGGLQKEAFFHDVPCIVLNEDTPWPELRNAGRLRLWIDEDYAPRAEVDDFGDGYAADKIADLLLR